MKNQLGIIILIVICTGLSAMLIWDQKRVRDQKSAAAEHIASYSNKWVEVSEQARQINTEFEARFARQKEELVNLTNSLQETSANLETTQGMLKSSQEQVTQRDARITDLEDQNQMLDRRALELSNSITNLNHEIADTRRRLAASEGDKATLTRELTQLQLEKASLERQFNDLSVLRAQVAKLKEDMNVSRRLEWMRKGLTASADQKGAAQLMQKSQLSSAATPARSQPVYDLNVEISADGTTRLIPSPSNAPAANPTR